MAYKPDLYVKFKDGKVIHPKSIYVHDCILLEKEIYADSVLYKLNTVSFYSDNWYEYANVSKKSTTAFAQKIVDGKINVYRKSERFEWSSSSPSGMSQHSGTAYTFYVQQRDANSVLQLSYKNLLPMIPEHTRAQRLLHRANITNKIMWGSFAVGGSYIIAGILSMKKASHETDGSLAPGIFMILGGTQLTVLSLLLTANNGSRLRKVVGEYNGE